jgi:hypothetical protein
MQPLAEKVQRRKKKTRKKRNGISSFLICFVKRLRASSHGHARGLVFLNFAGLAVEARLEMQHATTKKQAKKPKNPKPREARSEVGGCFLDGLCALHTYVGVRFF